MNILMVDDMSSVVNGMEKSIHWDKLGITGVYKAYNSYEAKVLLNNLYIDILMTDVEMPGEDGLDLVEWIRSEKMDIECIIISSHASFDYAKRAISMNSFQYVLLPCPYEEITSVVDQAVKKLKKRRKETELIKYGEIFKKDDWLDSILFGRCLEEQANKDAILHLEKTTGIRPMTGGYLCLLQLLNAPNITEQFDDKLLGFIFHNVLSELMQSWNEKIIMQQISREKYVFLVYDMDTNGCTVGIFQQRTEIIVEIMKKKLHMELDICFEYCKDLGTLPQAYHSLQDKGQVLDSYYKDNAYQNEPDNDIVKEIEIYVRDHIAQDIKRSEIADLLHMNIDYLARVFKKSTGVTLNDYIINERMAVAKNYLSTTKLPVSLIATKVGYYNYSYFSKLYKKTYGKTPTEERG